MRIAVIGASGFVGNRIVEQLVLRGEAEVVPIVRSFSSLGVLSRFDLSWKVCDIMVPGSLATALAGCDTVVHAALGDAGQIVKMAQSAYAAAEKAGVRRLVVLSSAAVHGLTPPVGTDERTPLHDRQAVDYNNAKVRAEWALLKARKRGRVELVMLRPSIVYGPRCRFFAGLAEKLRNHTAFLIHNGRGICNGIYVDNLITAVRLAIDCARADGEAFLVGDAETVTWREVYARLAGPLGIDLEAVHLIEPPLFQRSVKERVERFVATPIAQSILPAIPRQAKRFTKALLGALNAPLPSMAWALPVARSPVVDHEMAELQQCEWKYPNQKATRILGYSPTVSFDEGIRRTLGWLGFVGFPLANSGNAS